MNIEEAKKVYDRLEREEENIHCIVSTSEIQGEGEIVDAQNYYSPSHLITFFVEIPGKRKVEIPCFGVMIKE